MKQAKFHTCKSIFIEHVFQKWKNTQTIPHENIIYNGCNKANAQYHKAIRNSDYIVGITLAFFFTFPGIANRFHIVQVWQTLKIERNTHNHTNSHEN